MKDRHPGTGTDDRVAGPVSVGAPRVTAPASVAPLPGLIAGCCLGAFLAFAADPRDRFILARFPFDGTGAAALADASANQAVLSLGTDAALAVEGRTGAGLRLAPRSGPEATPTVVSLPAGKLPPTGFTVELWCRLSRLQLGHDGYLASSPNCYLRFSVDRNVFEFGVQTTRGWAGVSSPPRPGLSVQPDTWYHLAGAYDGSEVRLVIDRSIMVRTPAFGPVTPGAFRLGRCGWAEEPGAELDGVIDDLSFSLLPPVDGTGPRRAGPAATPVTGAGEAADRPYALIPRASQPPALDGKPAGGVWEEAVWVGNPVYAGEANVTDKLDLQVGLLWDDTALYAGYRVSQTRKPMAVTTTNGDDGLERDDAVELTLWVPGFARAQGQPVQFKLNCEGRRDDAVNFDFSWNADWDGAVSQDGNCWSATFRIPFAGFGVKPQVGDRWSANFGAFLVGYQYKAFLWSPISRGHHHDGGAGLIEFGGPGVPSSRVERLERRLGTVRVRGYLATPGEIELTLRPDGADVPAPPEPVRVRLSRANAFDLQTAPIRRPGSYWATTVVNVDGRAVLVDRKPVQVPASLEVQVFPYPVAVSALVVVRVHDLGREGVTPVRLSLSLRDDKGETVRAQEESCPPGVQLPLEWWVVLDKLASRASYQVVVTAHSSDAATTLDETVSLVLQPRPPWADTRAGVLDGKVPMPWTPVTADEARFACWGRAWDFADSLLPVSLVSAGVPLLAGPMRLRLGAEAQTTVSGKTDKPIAARASRTGDRADFRTEATDNLATVTVEGTLEFDGFTEFRVKLRPKQRLDQVSLDIPLTSAVCRYLQPLPGATNRDGCGALPLTGLGLDPLNTLWLAGDEVGLFFCCETTEDWQAPKGRALEITPSRPGEPRVLRLNWCLAPATIEGEHTFRFFLQATPVRPFNPDWFERGARVMNGLTWGHNQPLAGDPTGRTPLHLAQEAGAKTLIFFEHWCEWQNGGRSKREPELKRLVEDCHRLGLNVILYFGFEIPEDAPETRDLLHECKAIVGQRPNFYVPQSQNTYATSYASPYREYLLYNMERLKLELGIDGVYLDGSLNLAPSDNPAFGCGYWAADGKRASTVPVRRIREFAKRVNKLFAQDGGTVFAHLGVCPPTMGFASNTYYGEHVGFLNTAWESVPDRIPCEVSRALYSGRNTGVPMILCQQLMWPHLRDTHPGWFERTLAWADLHGVGVNQLLEVPLSAETSAVAAGLRRFTEFGADPCDWIPYWQLETGGACVPSAEVKMTVYRRADGALLCMVANLTGQPQTASLDLLGSDLLRPKPGAGCVALDTGTSVPVTQGRVMLELPAYGHRLLRVE